MKMAFNATDLNKSYYIIQIIALILMIKSLGWLNFMAKIKKHDDRKQLVADKKIRHWFSIP